MLCTQISLNLIVVLFQIPLFYYRSASLEKPSSSTPSSGHSELTISSDKSELPRGGGEYCMCIVYCQQSWAHATTIASHNHRQILCRNYILTPRGKQ